MNDPKDNICTWQQGFFVDGPEYKGVSKEQKDDWKKEEMYLVRSYSKGNPICRAVTPDDAQWIAQRLNLAAEFEQIVKRRAPKGLFDEFEPVVGKQPNENITYALGIKIIKD